MMYLTVIVNILVLTTAIRVPTVWPEQEKKLLKDQHTRSSNVNFNNLFKNKLNVEQRRTDANSFVENGKNPIGSFTQTKYLNNNNKKQFYKEKPYVGHNVPHLYNRDSSLRMQATTNAENNNDRKVIKYNRVDTTVRHNNLKNASFSRPLFNTNNNNFPTDTDDWVPITGHIDNHKIKESNNFDLLQDIKRKQHEVPYQKNSINKSTQKLSKDKIDLTPKAYNQRNDSIKEDDSKMPFKRSDIENTYSEHEHPKHIPTKPIYPGEGKWAIRGLKHTPYRKDHKISDPVEENTEQPQRIFTKSEDDISNWNIHALIHPYRNTNKLSTSTENTRESTTEHIEELEEFPKRIETKSEDAKRAIHKFIHAPNRSVNKIVKHIEDDEGKRSQNNENISKPHQEFPKRFTTKPDEETLNIRQFTQSPNNTTQKPVEDNKEETSQNHENVESPDDDSEELKENVKEEEYEDDENEDYEEGEKDDFVPTRVFSQVRNTEDEEHLPSHLLDTRLKESIKDSKIHTVYTEEGYEDVEYDHGGKEKNYKNSEGNVEFDKDAPKNNKFVAEKTKPLQVEVDVLKEFEKYDNSNLDEENEDLENDDDTDDAETSASNHENVKHNGNINKHQFGRTKESKTTEIRNMKDANMELEITSEIKTMMQPNNISSIHKFVKIIPKFKDVTHENSAKFLKPLRRSKRFTNDFHQVEVAKDFLDVLNIHHAEDPIGPSTVKYPYYNLQQTNNLNLNSPLRYAEDLKRIPEKVFGEMSFYEQSKISECPEIPKNVNPIPDRVNQTEAKEGNSSTQEPPKLPRLKNLGDHLDCLKIKLFGENPLDSPIFQESVIDQPQPIFKEFMNQIVQQTGIGSAPKSDLQLQETILNETADIKNTTNTINYEGEEELDNTNGTGTLDKLHFSERRPKSANLDNDDDHVEEDESEATIENETDEPLPESAPLIIRLRRRKRPILQKKAYRVNQQKFTTFSPLNSYITTIRIPPRYKTISEVFYKDDIQPNEQLNVLHDVMNNIKSASLNDPLVADSSESVKNSFKYFNPQSDDSRKLKVPSRKIRIKHNDSSGNYQTINTYTAPTTSTTTTTTAKPKRRIKSKKKNRVPSALVYEEYVNTVHGNNKLTKEKDSYASADNSFITASINTEIDDVVGLAPPILYGLPTSYSSITNFSPPANHLLVEKPMNTFLVEGMNPPIKRKPVSYSEFRLLSKLRPVKRIGHYNHHVYKRSSNKPSYSDIRRNRPTEASVDEDEEDDYMPQRNRNYYYDTKTRQVVYTGPQTEEPLIQPEEEDEEEEEEEKEDLKGYLVVHKPTPPTPPKLIVPLTTEKNGPSFLEIVNNLHQDSNYQLIPEPTKSSPKLSATPEETAEIKNRTQAAIESPKFISFLEKLKTSANYTEIPEKKVVVTTTQAPIVDEEEEEVVVEEDENDEETTKSNFKNHKPYGNTQIFDISEYLPVPQSYQPKAIDYSKYKTISRTPPPMQNTVSSDDNEESMEVKGHDSASDPTENSQIVRRTQLLEVTTEMFSPVPNMFTTTETPKVVSTPVRRVIMRGRKRPSTTTSKPTLSTIKLNLRRRSRPTTTTTEANLEEISTSTTRRMIIRRGPIRRISREDGIPLNHKEVYTPIDENMKNIPKNELVNFNEADGNGRHELQTRNIADVEVFKKFNRKQKHGGNYRKEDLKLNSVPPTAYNIENSEEMRLTDIVPKPFSFYSDSNLPQHVNLLNVSEKEIEKTEDVPSNEEKSVDNSTNREDVQNSEDVTEIPVAIVKDPSKRLYYYAPV